jgi:hypothetical protein
MKYWEIIADNLSKAGWSWGCVSAIDSDGRTIFVADAHRAGMEGVSLYGRMKSSLRLWNWNRQFAGRVFFSLTGWRNFVQTGRP